MVKRSIHDITHNFHAMFSNSAHNGVRKQIIFISASLLTVMLLSGLMLSTLALETMAEHNNSTQTMSDIYALNDLLDEWEAALDNYVLNATDLSRQECTDCWEALDSLLNSFYVGEHEPSQLALANMRALYRHTQDGMSALLNASDHFARITSYTQLTDQKEGLLFLSDQLMRLHIGEDVKTYSHVISTNHASILIFFFVLGCSAVLLIVCSRRMIRSVCTPIDLLVDDAKKMANGQYDTPAVEIITDDEMGYLSQVFNTMKSSVSANFKNMERIIELQELLQNTELKALQSQINPHFLFNVLSVAEEAALFENADQTVEIIEHISYMLQYSLKCTKQDTSFGEELRMVQSYLFLQEKRFGDRIRFQLDIPKNLPHQFIIPGMSLQPMVENAIRHGVEKMVSGGVVSVSIRKQDTYIEVTISDNGCGIDPILLHAIQQGESVQSKSGSGIGIVNVSRRMEIFYKQEGLFDISSTPNRGTSVVLRYPFTESQVNYV